jgi:hypothetical protein
MQQSQQTFSSWKENFVRQARRVDKYAQLISDQWKIAGDFLT